MTFQTIPDHKLHHVWRDDAGKEHTVPPTFYEESGTPVDGETGNDMTYVRTEIAVNPAEDADAAPAQGEPRRKALAKELKALLEKYDVRIEFECHPHSDLTDVSDARIAVVSNTDDKTLVRSGHDSYDLSARDIKV